MTESASSAAKDKDKGKEPVKEKEKDKSKDKNKRPAPSGQPDSQLSPRKRGRAANACSSEARNDAIEEAQAMVEAVENEPTPPP